MNYPTKNLRRILFLDIETASQYPSYEEAPEAIRSLWQHKMRHQVTTEEYPMFEEEFLAILKKHNIEFDTKYVFEKEFVQ